MEKIITNINTDFENEWWYHKPTDGQKHEPTDGQKNRLNNEVDVIVNAITRNEPKGNDPFWLKAEKIFLSALVCYIHEEEPELLNGETSLELLIGLVQEAEKNTLSSRLENFFERKPFNNVKGYYEIFELFEEHAVKTIVSIAYVDLQLFLRKYG